MEFRHPFPAVGVFILHENGIYLIKKSRSIFKGKWCTPGGKIEYGERIKETAKREVFEETGMIIDDLEFITFEETIERDSKGEIQYHFVFFNFKAKYVSGKITPSDEALEIELIPFSELTKYEISKPTLRTLTQMGLIDNLQSMESV